MPYKNSQDSRQHDRIVFFVVTIPSKASQDSYFTSYCYYYGTNYPITITNQLSNLSSTAATQQQQSGGGKNRILCNSGRNKAIKNK